MGPGRVSPTRFPGGHADGRAVVRDPGRHGGLGRTRKLGLGRRCEKGAPQAAVARAGREALRAPVSAYGRAGLLVPRQGLCWLRASLPRAVSGAERAPAADAILAGGPARAWGAGGGARAWDLVRQGPALASSEALLEGVGGCGGLSLDSSQVADSPLPLVSRPQKVVALQVRGYLENKGRPVSASALHFPGRRRGGQAPSWVRLLSPTPLDPALDSCPVAPERSVI